MSYNQGWNDRTTGSRVGCFLAVLAIVLLVLALTACSHHTEDPMPDPQAVRRIEDLLTLQPCIGRLDRWHRSYFYPGSRKKSFEGVIMFDLKEAGKYGKVAGTETLSAGGTHELDHRPMLIASGSYDIARDTLIVNYCGVNETD